MKCLIIAAGYRKKGRHKKIPQVYHEWTPSLFKAVFT
ncbi:hypothetical protein LCGC14_2179710, partial [marine sediment metagenome]